MNVFDHSTFKIFQPYACLPFVELASESIIQMGPVVFWPASKYKEFLDVEAHESFLHYLDTIRQIKTNSAKLGIASLIDTVKLAPEKITFVSISESIPLLHRDYILIDSFYLLYFACTFRNLYYNKKIPSFSAFRKVIPAEFSFILNRENWKNLFINESSREETICIHIVDEEICQSFGKLLNLNYQENKEGEENTPLKQTCKRLVRSIRYFIDRLFQRFVNVLNKGLNFSENIFEPEDLFFLVSSLEILLHINNQQPAADLKNKLRSSLHLKYSGVVEIFWKWVDDIYQKKYDIIHGETIINPTFKGNPNFDVSHMTIGVRIFIYSVCYTLFKCKFIHSIQDRLNSPPDFKWIHPEEILLLFWTETGLLKKLDDFINQAFKNPNAELLEEIEQITSLFVSLYENHYINPTQKGVIFKPVHTYEMSTYGQNILYYLDNILWKNIVHPRFKIDLQNRILSN